MTTVVTDNCRGCRFTDCVSVCPVEAFHVDDEMLYINPDVCIDCSACVPECPVEAIFEEDDLPDGQEHWVDINEERSQETPNITETTSPHTAQTVEWSNLLNLLYNLLLQNGSLSVYLGIWNVGVVGLFGGM